MQYSIKKHVLEALLSKAANVLATRDTVPILKNFNISVEQGKFRAAATDLDLSVIAETPLVDVTVAGRAVMPGKKFLDIVKECEDGIVTVAIADGSATITCAGATWQIQLMNADEYPDLPQVADSNPIEITRVSFMSALQKVKGAASKDSVRPALQMIDINGGMVRASDGAIFRQVTVPEMANVTMQIPLGAVEDLVRMLRATELEKVLLGQTEDHLLFIVGTDVFIVTKNSVEYPDVENMLLGPARKNKYEMRLDRAQLIAGIKRCRVTADEDTKGLVLALTSHKLTLRSRDKYGNWATQAIDVHWAYEDREIGVNHENLLDSVMSVDSPSIAILLGDDSKTRKSSLFIEDDKTICVLQQLKVDL